jgi:hypothetical protein
MKIELLCLDTGEAVYQVLEGETEVARYSSRIEAERYLANPEKPARRTWAIAGQCLYCDEHRRRGDKFLPPHDASRRCESGKRPHCTCDVCW